MTTLMPSEVTYAFQYVYGLYKSVRNFHGSITIVYDASYSSLTSSKGKDPYSFDMWVLGKVGEVESWTKVFKVRVRYYFPLQLFI